MNIDWTTIILGFIGFLGATGIFIGIQNHNKQIQKSGNNSKNYQSNGDIYIGVNENDK